jgi:hypothetical protein
VSGTKSSDFGASRPEENGPRRVALLGFRRMFSLTHDGLAGVEHVVGESDVERGWGSR